MIFVTSRFICTGPEPFYAFQKMFAFKGDLSIGIVTDKKSLNQPACPKEWKKYEEGNKS
jgi:hypothetical protein